MMSSSSQSYVNAAKHGQNISVQRTKILLLGTRRSGKTSIQQVLFHHLPAKQTFYLEPTMRVAKHEFDTVIPLEIWDCPGNITVDSLGASLADFATIIFVIDIRDLYQQPVSKLVEFIVAACQVNPDINFEVFVHKAEKLQEDDKIENFRQIHERVVDRLADESPEYEQVPLNFHLTSVYDHSLQEAFSRVLHKLIDSLPYLEDLLNVFCLNTSSPKAFLFDTASKLYLATDSSPVDQATHNLCCDYLQMLTSFGPLYKSNAEGDIRAHLFSPTPTPPPTATPSPPSFSTSPSSTLKACVQSPPHTPSNLPLDARNAKPLFYPSAATSLSPSHPGTTLSYHLVTPHLALLALLPTTIYDMRRGLVEWNVVWFREGVREIWEVEKERSNAEGV
ncbi:Gtr1/RagA G protein conserved region-domain-containing protein [Hygrophoropsis aurantiaca]|uniref:Gtr1/RagA G protein conserved region-domain-containing protein n=1 Tax=Hygrophoropsis aurantiaca TaxID=72124 RepID=A0ACB8AK76_9AGAM|nr:Gtr1/RagA G protein conserved region-domain-containing protein [Hygrophoropsis aurantiaca]